MRRFILSFLIFLFIFFVGFSLMFAGMLGCGHGTSGCSNNFFTYLGLLLIVISLLYGGAGLFRGTENLYSLYNAEKHKFEKNDEIQIDKNSRETLQLLSMHLMDSQPRQSTVLHDNVKETAVITYINTYNICLTQDGKQIQKESFKDIEDLGTFLIKHTRFRVRDFV